MKIPEKLERDVKKGKVKEKRMKINLRRKEDGDNQKKKKITTQGTKIFG